jgi:hypothetical protein
MAARRLRSLRAGFSRFSRKLALRGCDFFDFSRRALLKEKDLSALKMAKSQ